MHAGHLQKMLAYTALFLLPFPALNFGVSFTYADVFLLAAIALNSNALLRVHTFQIPFLLALPFFLVSALMDPDGDLTSVMQILYIWGVVLPFGWCALANLPLRRIAQVILASAAVNSIIAVGQYLMIAPMLENQKTILLGGEAARAAGLSTACNSLVMGLTPCFVLLSALRNPWLRVVTMMILIAGLVSSVSKSILLALPVLLFYLWREPQKRSLAPALAVTLLSVGLGVERTVGLGHLWSDVYDTIEIRAETADSSIEQRAELFAVALDFAADCFLFGYGTEGTFERISENAEFTVHVYYLGLVVIAGLPAAALLCWGMLLQLAGLWRAGQVDVAAFLAGHLLACTVMTVLLLSYQSLPFIVAGAVLARQTQTTTATASDSAARASSSAARQRQLAAVRAKRHPDAVASPSGTS